MCRNAIRLAPGHFAEQQGAYLRRPRTHNIVFPEDNIAILRARQSFFEAPDGAVLCDVDEAGFIPPEFLVGVYARSFSRGRCVAIGRLKIDAAIDGVRRAPHSQAADDSVPTPGLKSDYVALNLPHIESLYGPASTKSGRIRDFDERAGNLPPALLSLRAPHVPRLAPSNVFSIGEPAISSARLGC